MNPQRRLIALRLPLLVMTLVTALSLSACVAAIPLIIARLGDRETATVEVPRSAADVYSTAVDIASKEPQVRILERDDASMLLSLAKGQQQGSVKVVALGPGSSQLVIHADSGQGAQADHDLALRVAKRVCDALGVNYRIVR